MIDLPDHGYVTRTLSLVDASGTADGSLGGPSQRIDRPGLRYAVTYEIKPLASSGDARIFEAMLEQGLRDDVSYPWPLDVKSLAAGVPLVDGVNPPGSTLFLKGLTPQFQFRIGQPFALINAAGVACIHRAAAGVAADAGGHATLQVFPDLRVSFEDNDVVEVERPRIRGLLSWNGSDQGPAGVRAFQFTVTERQ
jgi:hypothetical protein